MRESAERDRAVPVPASAADREETLSSLAWLVPSASSLTVLCRPITPATWESIRYDPGAVLLAARHGAGGLPWSIASLSDPRLLESSLRDLESPNSTYVDWSAPASRPIYQFALRCAHTAQGLAARHGCCDPEAAWVGGLLAPLGWLAACAVEANPLKATYAADLGRRLARRWCLPSWLLSLISHLDLPASIEMDEVEPDLLHCVQTAVASICLKNIDLGLVPADVAEIAVRALNVSFPLDLPEPPLPPACIWQEPANQPLLHDLLLATAENRRLRGTALHRSLEQENDTLHAALRQQVRTESDRLRSAKLTSLAEFAAGAGHEINNPLAVISGQAQYLLGHGEEWFDGEADAARKALQTIVSQSKRIHGVLRDLMQFARPAAPRPEAFDLPELFGEVTEALREVIDSRRTRIEIDAPTRFRVVADLEQTRQILLRLLRNAVEASPIDGWARIRLLPSESGSDVKIQIEDNGPGPDESQRQHLFDPFYSGRSAGRGRGLGLPIAWRLARLQQGDVHLESIQPTRFVFRLPRREESPSLLRAATALSKGA